MAMPVVGEAGFELEQLAGEAVVVRRRTGDGMDCAEGPAERAPDEDPRKSVIATIAHSVIRNSPPIYLCRLVVFVFHLANPQIRLSRVG